MPRVTRPAALKAVYEEASRKIRAREIPTELIMPDRILYRAFDEKYVTINGDGFFRRHLANQALVIRDEKTDSNRYSGRSFHASIPASGGLYCSLQQHALVNELLHYARRNASIPLSLETGFPSPDATLQANCIVKIHLMSSILAADLSAHNPAARKFLDELGDCPAVRSGLGAAGGAQNSLWEQLLDREDCSVARGIGLAVANSGYLHALQATTAQPSDRELLEVGDNLVLFGLDGQQGPNLWIEEAYVFPLAGKPEVYPVQF